MSAGVPNPGELAQRSEGRRDIVGDGPAGDDELDDVVGRLRESVDAIAGESLAGSGPGRSGTDVDAADVIACAHDVHEILQRRLDRAQA